MTRQSQQYPRELRERAVRMVAEVTPNYESQRAAMGAVAQKLGVGTAETVRKWVRRAEVDAGQRPGTTSEESVELRRLKRENAELLSAECAAVVHVDPANCRPGSGLAWLTRGASPASTRVMRSSGPRVGRPGRSKPAEPGISMGLRISSRAFNHEGTVARDRCDDCKAVRSKSSGSAAR